MAQTGRVPLLSSACYCCISLRTGSLFIGWYHLLQMKQYFLFDGYVLLYAILWLASGYLVWGIRRGRPGFVSTFLVANSLSILYGVFLFVILQWTPLRWEMQYKYQSKMGGTASEAFCEPSVKLIEVVIALYCQWVVYSYHCKDLRQGFNLNSGGYVA